jgi:transposase InsO family protein
VPIRYTERLAETGIEPSVGSAGDSYDNALAEMVIGLFRTEVIHRRGRGAALRRSSSPPSSGSTGSTPAACSSRSDTSRGRAVAAARLEGAHARYVGLGPVLLVVVGEVDASTKIDARQNRAL